MNEANEQVEDTQDAATQPQTRAVRVPEKFTQRFLMGLDAEGNQKYVVLVGVSANQALVDRILDTDATPRGRGGMTREITVTRDEYQSLYELLADARRYMQNVDKEQPGKLHRDNTLSGAVGADAAAKRMEKDEVWGIDNPQPYVPKRRRKAAATTPVTQNDGDGTDTTSDATTDGDQGDSQPDTDLSSVYTPATLDTAEDTEEVSQEDANFIQQDVQTGNG